jgi:hypothetical protein
MLNLRQIHTKQGVNTTNLAHQSNSNVIFTQYFYGIFLSTHQSKDDKQ